MTEPTLDSAVYRELQDTAGADFAAELAATFLEEAQGMLAEVQQAQAAGDATAFARAAHSLKSNALTFGLARLAARARALELGGLAAGSTAALAELRAEFDAAACAGV
jgi:HPt (histidine-containing phosphotransfer) domain-containing protein